MRIPLAKESLPILVGLALLSAALAWVAWPAAIVPALAFAFSIWFFRDPQRRVPDEDDALVAPADGKVIRAEGERVSIFMNVFDVHVCRAPFPGTVRSLRHHPGRFLAAFKDDAPRQNERVVVELEGRAPVSFVLIAGLVARRIVVRIAERQQLRRGERVGLIRFGSRVDIRLPPGAALKVRVGDRVRAGESIVARVP